ncbi:hypothetical protein [Undibacterium sp. TJN19]|uniref:hypothetical protein n=1 Tax=Undibacterium sp. TJN19 TaxID=3413055 RepID=UPI003BF3BEC2
MNAIQRNQLRLRAAIFPDASINTQFYIAIELMAQLVMVMPAARTVATLAKVSGHKASAIRPVLEILAECGLVNGDIHQKDSWLCGSWLGNLTLAHIYNCFYLAAEKSASAIENVTDAAGITEQNSYASLRLSDAKKNSLDLLMMQVKITVNNAVLQQLEQFDLERLRGLAPSGCFRSHHGRPRSYIPEPC